MYSKNSVKEQQKITVPAKIEGIPVLTANITIINAKIKVEILKPSSNEPEGIFEQNDKGILEVLNLLSYHNVKGVRLSGKKKDCHILAEDFLKRGIRPLIDNDQKSKKQEVRGLPVINEFVAGIDIGKSLIYVAIPPHFDKDHTRAFTSFTDDLEAIVKWLKEHSITEVAMESTSVYWSPLYEMCQQNGIKPLIVNPKYVKTLPGRKTDVLDSQWLMRLLSCGLLQGGFIPEKQIRELRDLARHRQDMMGRAADCLNVMHKALSLMNIQLGNVISDISGKSGLAIMKAIATGERNLEKLASLADDRCKCTKEEMKRALKGTYDEAQIFIMKQEMDLYEHHHKKIIEGELKIKELLEKLPDAPERALRPQSTKRKKKKARIQQKSLLF